MPGFRLTSYLAPMVGGGMKVEFPPNGEPFASTEVLIGIQLL